MGYYDATLELMKAHRSLSDRYSEQGGAEMYSKLKAERQETKPET
jgi:hypothetical protein